MIDFLQRFDPVVQTLFATIFTWGMTALGAATVFAFKKFNQKILDVSMTQHPALGVMDSVVTCFET